MARAKLLTIGQRQFVRIPAALAYADATIALEITRTGDVLTVRPVTTGLRRDVARLRRMPKPPRIERRVKIDMPERGT